MRDAHGQEKREVEREMRQWVMVVGRLRVHLLLDLVDFDGLTDEIGSLDLPRFGVGQKLALRRGSAYFGQTQSVVGW